MFYLIDYIKNNFDIDESIIDNIKYELDQRVYYYGAHFKRPKEQCSKKVISAARNIAELLSFYKRIKYIKADANKKNIISNAYFTTNHELKKLGYNVYCPVWWTTDSNDILTDKTIYKLYKSINNKLNKADFIELIDNEFIVRIEELKEYVTHFYRMNNVVASVVPNDISFFENLTIRIFRELERPSFIFLHGLPGRYNKIDENRSDYLVVWGEKIKENYIKAGFEPGKIFVSGHPSYATEPKIKNLTFSFENILVLSKSLNGAQCSDRVRLSDRGNSILYLYSIMNVLKKIGIKKVRLRLHPAESPEWYCRFIDKDFFIIEQGPLDKALSDSSLIIGPTSTVFVESFFYGVNYLVYEPTFNNLDLINYEPVPPFDASDKRIPVAQNESDFEFILKNRLSVDANFWHDYISTPFNLDFMNKIIR